MLKLKSQTSCHFSNNILKLLAQNHITTILDFLQEDVTKLATITKLNLPEILDIRSDILTKYSAPLINGTTLLKKVFEIRRRISTAIKSLDTATGGGIPIGYITEICGLAESGKTQLSFQIAVNCVRSSENNVLYVDTKGDFSAVRIQKMLASSRYTHKEMAEIMYKVSVVHIWTMNELVELFKSIKNKTLSLENLALIIVDSLPCLMFQYLGDENKIGLSLLNTLVNYSRFIGNELNVGIVYINIQTRWIDPDGMTDMEDEAGSSVFKEPTYYVEKRNRCLGKYWEQVPNLVLILEKLDHSKETCGSSQIKVSVLNSTNSGDSQQCVLQLSASGVQ